MHAVSQGDGYEKAWDEKAWGEKAWDEKAWDEKSWDSKSWDGYGSFWDGWNRS